MCCIRYTIRNVSRCWAYETAVALDRDQDLPNQLPMNDFWHYYAPDYKLQIQPVAALHNLNAPSALDKVKTECLKNVELLKHAPGVEFAYLPWDVIETAKRREERRQEYLQIAAEKQELMDDDGDGQVGRSGVRPALHAYRNAYRKDHPKRRRKNGDDDDGEEEAEDSADGL
ncbi:hypothetical protein FOZ63_007200 [Perkinsus olseni]|uniref:Uncharacterized protein n=1 Tax=Perkinsus olseni TaxID=32597 RepID=A0A7J6R3M1_PEROL|nr:hypothetical protein FOZ63_007200 [Perkinsus olseni]